jgi:hypothetical protein
LETPGGEEFQHVTTKPAIYNILFKRLVWVFSSWNEPLIEGEFLYDKGCAVMQPRANASKLQSPDKHLILFVGALLQPLFCHDGSTNEVSATFQYLILAPWILKLGDTLSLMESKESLSKIS